MISILPREESALNSGSRKRIVLLGLLIVALFAAAVGVLLLPEDDEEVVSAAVDRMVDAFEKRDPKGIVEEMSFPLTVTLNGQQTRYDQEDWEGELQHYWSMFRRIDIRGVSKEAEMGEEQWLVTFRFHWTVATHLLPNEEFRSERENRFGRPSQAVIKFMKKEGEWQVYDIELRV